MKNTLRIGLLGLLAFAGNAQAGVIWDLTPFTGDPIGVQIVVEDHVNPNTLQITASVLPFGGNTLGDIRGIFFNIDGGIDNVTADMFSGSTTDTVAQVCLADGVVSCTGDNNLNGGGGVADGLFNVGIEIGSSGIGQGDDFQTATILFNYGALGLTVDDLGPFGARVTSVGTATARGGSSKLLSGDEGVPDTETAIPEPSTWMSMFAGLSLLAIARFRRNRRA